MNTRVVREMKSVQPRLFDEYSGNETPPSEFEILEDGWSIKNYIKRKPIARRASANKPNRNTLRTASELFIWDTSLKLQENSRYATLPNSPDKPGPNFSHVFSALDYYQHVTPGPSKSSKFFATFPPKRTQKLSPINKPMVSIFSFYYCLICNYTIISKAQVAEN
ncbi:hypothetical protein LOD99_16142 [Oopsacas minuta]|uniref:Uncharacterized protein n=1 Tax=Oopsacas minuta TaxID=111878 RepID=A0AAV7K8I2_9METZ|nr:hypothetical protein LOD99_16142 [Oopsacas minuta]